MIEKILAQCGRGTIVSSLAGLSDFKPTSLMALDIETFGADKLPGDSPYSPLHGICGLAVANAEGDARYILVDDSGGKRPGVPVAELAEYANRSWLTKDRTIIFHNAKFDLGFLMARGFEFGTVNLQDTWILHSILCKGVFVSNRLKDIMKARFGISVVSEEVLKKWKAAGYRIQVTYLMIDSVQLALRRIAARVKQGGHDVPREIVLRRFGRSWANCARI